MRFDTFNTATFRVSGSDQRGPTRSDGGPNSEFGLGAARVGAQWQAQLGLRVVSWSRLAFRRGVLDE